MNFLEKYSKKIKISNGANSIVGTCCWLWQGSIVGGYGQCSIHGKRNYVHRVAWEETHGKIGNGLLIDHICRERSCCNPEHLRVVTRSVNSRENSVSPWALNATKTHCCRGHIFDAENTFISKRGRRVCKRCSRERRR